MFIPMVVLAGCSMYGAKPAGLTKVAEIKHKAVVEPPLPPPVYDDNCVVYAHEGGKVVPQRAAAAQRVAEGDAKLAGVEKEANHKAKIQLVVDAAARYFSALKADPFDADATLHLALVYDKTYRRGCALKLLDRLSALARVPKLSPHATSAVNDVQAHGEWFVGYRNDATDAVQGLRSTP